MVSTLARDFPSPDPDCDPNTPIIATIVKKRILYSEANTLKER